MPEGIVKWFDPTLKYGFIATSLNEDGEEDILLHVSALEKAKFDIPAGASPKLNYLIGKRVVFDIIYNKNRKRAINLKIIEDRKSEDGK